MRFLRMWITLSSPNHLHIRQLDGANNWPDLPRHKKENKEFDCIICHMRIIFLLANVWAEYAEYVIQYIIIIACPYVNLVNFKANELIWLRPTWRMHTVHWQLNLARRKAKKKHKLPASYKNKSRKWNCTGERNHKMCSRMCLACLTQNSRRAFRKKEKNIKILFALDGYVYWFMCLESEMV